MQSLYRPESINQIEIDKVRMPYVSIPSFKSSIVIEKLSPNEKFDSLLARI